MSLFLLLIVTAVVATVIFDWVYFLPRFKEMEEVEKKVIRQL